ncbi:MAG: hypothetical protein KAG61_07710 [Bacteriovoracaceae bacterium]|nr:hypothetical protein [Bacteriovoracaceae bacterium]
MRKISIAIIALILACAAQAKVLDKIIAVVDDKIITLSIVERIKTNLQIRQNIAPFIYNKSKLTNSQVAENIINSKMIRDKLSEFGFVVGDEQVQGNVKQRIAQLGLSQKQLIQFLKQNNMNFDEYFELTREAMEYSLFVDRVISPLISVTEQEIKNTYYKRNLSNQTLSFKYDLVDFYLPKSKLGKNKLSKFKDVLVKFQNTGNLPKAFEGVETNTLGELTEDGLTPGLKKLLKKTDEGSFSAPFLLADDYHVFFVKQKDLVESEDFAAQKRKIRGELMKMATDKMTGIWLARQKNGHYVKYFK